MAPAKANVLVLHGDPGVRMVLRRVALSLDLAVDEAGTAGEAIDAARVRAPHLLVAEWAAIIERGQAFFDELLAACGGYEPQVIATARAAAGATDAAARGLGIAFVLTEPLDEVLLRQAMAGAVAVARKVGEPPPPLADEPVEPGGEGSAPPRPSSPPAASPVVAGFRDERQEDEGLWDGETSSSPLDLEALFDSAEGTATGTRGDTVGGAPRGDEGAWAVDVDELGAERPPVAEPTDPGLEGVDGLADLLEPPGEDTSPGEDEATLAGEDTDSGRDASSAAPDETDELQRPAGFDLEAALGDGDRGVVPRKEVVVLSSGTPVGGIVVESGFSATATFDEGDLVIESDHPEPLEFGVPEPDEPRPARVPPPPGVRQAAVSPSPSGIPRPAALPPKSPPPAALPPARATASPPPPPVAERPSRPSVEVVPGLPSSGDLRRVNAVELFAAAVRGKVTGGLTLESDGRRRLFHWSSGRLAGLSCAHLSDGLIPFLFSRGDLDGDGGDRALAEATAGGADHAEVLFRLGLLDPSKLVDAMGAHVAAIATESLGWAAGTFTFDPASAGPKGPPLSGVNAAALVVTAMIRNAGSRRLAALVDLPPQAAAVAVADAPVRLADLPLPSQEARVRDLALAGAQVGEIVDRGGLPADEARAALRAFYVLGAIGIDPTGGAAADRPAASRTSRAPAPVRPTTPPGRPTTPPGRPTTPPSARPTAAPRRAASPRSAKAPTPEPPPVGSSGEPLPSLPARGLPSAEQAVGPEELAKGQARALWDAWHALERGEPLDALEPLRENIEADRQNPLYHLYLGWTTYRANRESVKLAERCVLEASRLDREAPEPFYLMAEICGYEGQTERAERFVERAKRLDAARAAAESNLLGSAKDVDIRRELHRAMKDYFEEEKRAKEAREQGRGLFGRFLRGK